MVDALILALRQLSDPAIKRLLGRCMLLTLVALGGLIVALPAGLSLLEATGIGWLDSTLAAASSVVGVVLAWLLFPVVVTALAGLYAERVIEAVERRHYPGLPPARGAGVTASALGTVRFTAVMVLLNLLALPFYLMLPAANILLYLALNGYLLGREYFELVASRRLSWPQLRALRRRERGRLWFSGMAIAALAMVPVLNLIAPVLAVAFMVHRFETLRRRTPAAGDGADPVEADRSGIAPPATEVFDFARSDR
jgi:CysZ protein